VNKAAASAVQLFAKYVLLRACSSQLRKHKQKLQYIAFTWSKEK